MELSSSEDFLEAAGVVGLDVTSFSDDQQQDLWEELVAVQAPLRSYQAKRLRRTSFALDNAVARECIAPITSVEAGAMKALALPVPHRGRLNGYWPRGDVTAAAPPPNEERSMWVKKIIERICELKLPALLAIKDAMYAEGILTRLCGGLRASTLRKRFMEFERMYSWMRAQEMLGWPRSVHVVLDYLVERSAEPCSPSVPSEVKLALSFYEKSGNVAAEERWSEDGMVVRMVHELKVELEQGRRTTTRKAPPILLKMIIALEAAVCRPDLTPYERVFAWYRLTRIWTGMRWNDTRSVPRESVEYDAETGLKMLVTATKTTGPGKRVVVLECYISTGAYFYKAQWLYEGFRLWKDCGGDMERTYLLPAPSSSRRCFSQREPTYIEAAAMGKACFSDLGCFQLVMDREGKASWVPDPTQFYLFGGVSEALSFFSEHGDRATLASWAAVAGFDKEERNFVGRWNPDQSDAYVREARQMVARIQGEVASQCRKNPLAFQEETTLRLLHDHLINRGVSEEAVGLLMNRLRVPTCEVNTVPEDIYEDYEESADEGQAAVAPVEPEGGVEAGGPASSQTGSRERADYPYIVCLRRAHEAVTLHLNGGCWRRAGVHYKMYELVDEEDLEVRAMMGATGVPCRDCFRRVPLPKVLGDLFAEDAVLGSDSEGGEDE